MKKHIIDDIIKEEHLTNIPIVKKKFKPNLTIPWIEKYRPREVKDIVANETTIKKINKIIHDGEMPNIIITGSPGIGKTTTLLCMARTLMGKYYSQGVLELNASDDRGIKAVQDLIIYFCKKKMDVYDKNDNKIKFKLVLLDEADNMTIKAQRLINNLMDTYCNTTRFAFTCNDSSKIIESIQSRCVIFKYAKLTPDQIHGKLKYICGLEKIDHTDDGLNAITLTSSGDMRHAINNLQLTYNGYKYVNAENVYKLCDKPHPLIIEGIFIACHKKDIREALSLLNKLKIDGYAPSDISITMINILKVMKNSIPDDYKIKYLFEVGNTALTISKGINSYLQLTGCIAKLCNI